MRIIKSLKLEIYSDNIYKDIMAARVPRQLRLISLLRYSSHYYVTHLVTTLLVSLLRLVKLLLTSNRPSYMH